MASNRGVLKIGGGRRPDPRGRGATARAPRPVPITLSELDGVRYLHFGSPWVQGAMRISRPHQIVLDYVQQMMGWRLFLHAPGRILQLGLGAGALTRACLHQCADSAVTVVEAADEVIDVARAWFALPADGPRLEVVHADAGDFVANPARRGRYGVVQVDLYDRHARGPVLESAAFYRACAAALADPGVFVVNLFGAEDSYSPNVERVARAFGGRVLEFPAVPAGNRVVLGFKGPPLAVSWSALEQRARRLKSAAGLPAPQWVAALRAVRGGTSLTV